MTPWWHDAVFYQVYPRSFADSDGDGVGDLPGVRSRLPYLRSLGVDAVWLSPFYLSPQTDGGYDIEDYRAVDPLFGTMADARALLSDAHALGLRVIVDLVPNHSSSRHPWFREALASPGSDHRARYHFQPGRDDGPPNDWQSLFGGPAWTRTTNPDGTPGDWYLHLFSPEQPDFDWTHPAVAEEFRCVLRHWLDLGVDGFRVDVAHGLVKAPGLPDHGMPTHLLDLTATPFWDQDGVHDIYRDWRRLLDTYPGERVAVAEAWGPTLTRTAHYVRPDELHQAFNFHYLTCPWDPVALRAVIDDSLSAMSAVGAPATWVLSNHDVVRHATRLAPDADPETGLRRARAATLLMLALPGSAYLYQGEELGLPEVRDLPPHARRDPAFARTCGRDGFRDGCRIPMPWEGRQPPYGFSPPDTRTWLPQPLDWGGYTVAAQTADPTSTLEMYRAALTVRKTLHGELVWLPTASQVLAFERGTARCAVNLGDRPCTIDTGGVDHILTASGPVRHDGHRTSVPPDTTIWWRVAPRVPGRADARPRPAGVRDQSRASTGSWAVRRG